MELTGGRVESEKHTARLPLREVGPSLFVTLCDSGRYGVENPFGVAEVDFDAVVVGIDAANRVTEREDRVRSIQTEGVISHPRFEIRSQGVDPPDLTTARDQLERRGELLAQHDRSQCCDRAACVFGHTFVAPALEAVDHRLDFVRSDGGPGAERVRADRLELRIVAP